MSEASQRVWSDDEIRNVCNETTPHDAFVMVLTLMQRQTIALERIAASMEQPPTVLFEEAPTSDKDDDIQH